MPEITEIEIKLKVDDLTAARKKLTAEGAKPQGSRVFEDNRVFDFADRRLKSAGTVLRLRWAAGHSILTVKQKLKGPQGPYKVRREMETEVEDGETTRSILKALGLTTVYRYQKYRTHLRHGRLCVSLDETPLGVYMELEGPREEIDSLAARLGYSLSDYINLSYRGLHQEIGRAQGKDEEPTEMIFPEPHRS
ncbi:MAG: class IV adenylate cyclase [Acidobacteriota bacterium]